MSYHEIPLVIWQKLENSSFPARHGRKSQGPDRANKTISSASLAWSDQPDQPRSLSPSLATQKIRKFLRNEWQPLILSEAAP
jgi:hypothetical protein